jgi:hypothetical protein
VFDEINNEDNVIDPNEPRYCLCNRVSFGTMIGCENNNGSVPTLRDPKEKSTNIIFSARKSGSIWSVSACQGFHRGSALPSVPSYSWDKVEGNALR